MADHRDSICAAWIAVCTLVAPQVCNGRVCVLLMAEVSVPCPLGRVVHASGNYKSREHTVSHGPLEGWASEWHALYKGTVVLLQECRIKIAHVPILSV